MVRINPFTILNKFSLNLRNDETIKDVSYCVTDDNKYHCLWILDQKQQIVRCSDENNPNQYNWTIQRY